MGKGTIISGGDAGLYQVQINYNQTRYDKMIAALDNKIAEIDEALSPLNSELSDLAFEKGELNSNLDELIGNFEGLVSDMEALQVQVSTFDRELIALKHEDPPDAVAIATKTEELAQANYDLSEAHIAMDKNINDQAIAYKEAATLELAIDVVEAKISTIKLEKTANTKRKQYLAENVQADTIQSVWCADLTTDLSGSVSTVEIPGSSGVKTVLQIHPGYDGAANYDEDEDGQLFSTISITPAQAYYNLAMLPGQQKWKPRFRYGTLTGISEGLGTIILDSDYSKGGHGLNINQSSTLSGVPFEYMECDDVVFTVGDEVLVMFQNQDFASPKIIGFKDNPKGCYHPAISVRNEAGYFVGYVICLNKEGMFGPPYKLLLKGEYELLPEARVSGPRPRRIRTRVDTGEIYTPTSKKEWFLKNSPEWVFVGLSCGYTVRRSVDIQYKLHIAGVTIDTASYSQINEGSGDKIMSWASIGGGPDDEAIKEYNEEVKPVWMSYNFTSENVEGYGWGGNRYNKTSIGTGTILTSDYSYAYRTKNVNDGAIAYTKQFVNIHSAYGSDWYTDYDRAWSQKVWYSDYSAIHLYSVSVNAFGSSYEILTKKKYADPTDLKIYIFGYNQNNRKEDKYKITIGCTLMGNITDKPDHNCYYRICDDVKQHDESDMLILDIEKWGSHALFDDIVEGADGIIYASPGVAMAREINNK